MAAEQLANNYSTTLNGAITAGALTLIVATAPPAALLVPQWRIIVESEIMLVTAIASTTLTVTRGAEGTAAATHASGVVVDHDLTAASLLNLPYGVKPARDQLTDSVNGDATLTATFATLISRTIVTGANPVLVVVSGAGVNSSAAALVSFDLLVDGVSVGGTAGVTRLDTGLANADFSFSYAFLSQSLTAASHSFSFQGKQSGGVTTIYRGAGIPLHMGVMEIG